MPGFDRPGTMAPRLRNATDRGTIYEVDRMFDVVEMEPEWDAFMSLREDSRRVIVEALNEIGHGGITRRYVREFKMSFDEYISARVNSTGRIGLLRSKLIPSAQRGAAPLLVRLQPNGNSHVQALNKRCLA